MSLVESGRGTLLQNRALLAVQAHLDAKTAAVQPAPLLAEELQFVLDRGNDCRYIGRKLSGKQKVNLYRLLKRWQDFCSRLASKPEWKCLLSSISPESKGVVEAFVRYLVREGKIRRSKGKMCTGRPMDDSVKRHTLNVIKAEVTPAFALKREPRRQSTLGQELFIYLAYFLWVRDQASFDLGLDRIDDATLRLFYMWTGVRMHELVFAYDCDTSLADKELEDLCQAYSNPVLADQYAERRTGSCWVCNGKEVRDLNPLLRVLCWEDIDLWIVRDPERDGGRDRLAMQVLFRYHKGSHHKVVPTWFILLEEDNAVICPITHILAKALAEGVIEDPRFQTAEAFFNTKLSKAAAKIRWKKEWLHTPVFRSTEKTVSGFERSELPLTAKAFSSRTTRLGKAAGVEEQLSQYSYRRGFAQAIASNYSEAICDQVMRHKPHSTVYHTHYQNKRINALPQDAFFDREKRTAYLALLNYMGLRCDPNAPKMVPVEILEALPPNKEVLQLEEEVAVLSATLKAAHGTLSRAPKEEKDEYDRKRNQLRAMKQNVRREICNVLRKAHFNAMDDEALGQTSDGAEQSLTVIQHQLPERRAVAEIFSDMDTELSQEEIVAKKIAAINAMIAYAFKHDPAEPKPQSRKRQRSLTSSATAVCTPVSSVPAVDAGPRIAPRPAIDTASAPSMDPLLKVEADTHVELPSKPVPPAKSFSCIFCNETFTRKSNMWTHVDGHLFRANGGKVPCPRPECKAVNEVLDDPVHFKNHAARVHDVYLRPKIKLVTRLKGAAQKATKPQVRIVVKKKD